MLNKNITLKPKRSHPIIESLDHALGNVVITTDFDS